jgi:predicted ester cyclase
MAETKTKPSAKKKPTAKEIASTYFAAVRDQDLDGMAACWEAGSLDRLYGMADLRVPDDLRAWFGSLFRAFPDFRLEATEIVAYGDKAAVRWHATGTFTGPGRFEGIAATGASVELEGLDLLTIKDGKIVENQAYTNGMEMARQLGAMPPAGSVAEKAMFGMVNGRTAAAGLVKRLRERS